MDWETWPHEDDGTGMRTAATVDARFDPPSATEEKPTH
jgi:hypothetical protein